MKAAAPRLALTLGDPAGIGPEILLKAFAQAPELTRGCFIVGDLDTLARARGWLGQSVPELQRIAAPVQKRARLLYTSDAADEYKGDEVDGIVRQK